MSPMRPFSDLLTFDEAKKMIMENTKEIDRTEMVGIKEANGRILASDLVAHIDVPGFKRASMDGYAVIAEDTFEASREMPKLLVLKGKVFPGKRPDIVVEAKSCIQVATGAPLPEGANAVVIVEETDIEGGSVSVFKPVYPGANISQRDSDISQGTSVLSAGTLLGPSQIGVAASLGMDQLEVYARPKVMIFPTGDEVVPTGNDLRYGQVYDINSYTLYTLLSNCGADVSIGEITGDTEEAIETCLDIGSDSDYVVFSGGSSVGERDLLVTVLEKKGDILFHGIALKPGKPTLCGTLGETLVFGMPGYPTSCLTNGYVLLTPSVRKMARIETEDLSKEVTLAERILSSVGRHQIYPVKVQGNMAHPVFKRSGDITSMSQATGYIEIPANTEFLEKGHKVRVNYF